MKIVLLIDHNGKTKKGKNVFDAITLDCRLYFE
ncbi:MAG: hypothetical protein PARBA_00755 [Parabacteroides sp.]